MATRSFIGYKRPDKKIEGIYVHSDGYPSGVGKTLYARYKGVDKLKKIMELGHLSNLGASEGKKGEAGVGDYPFSNVFTSTAFKKELETIAPKMRAKFSSKIKAVNSFLELLQNPTKENLKKALDFDTKNYDFVRFLQDSVSNEGMKRKLVMLKDYGKTVSYSRDRGETDQKSKVFSSLSAFYKYGYNSDAEWIYLAIPDENKKLTWYTTKVKSAAVPPMAKWVKVRDAIGYKNNDPKVKLESEVIEMLEEGFFPDFKHLKSFGEYLEDVV